ncbi:MAG: metalloregulator ArsR/SmtB family transcription factor [Pseudomonadota bacterium]
MSKVDRAAVFAALGEPIRLQLLDQLGERRSISQLAKDLPISRQAVTQHLRVLERSRLIESHRSGRETHFVARPDRLVEAKSWLDDVTQQWDNTLARLKRFAEEK